MTTLKATQKSTLTDTVLKTEPPAPASRKLNATCVGHSSPMKKQGENEAVVTAGTAANRALASTLRPA